MMDNKVIVNLEDYVQLRQESEVLQNILKLIMDNASLNYNSTELRLVSPEKLMDYLKITEETIYNDTLTDLQKKEKSGADD